MKTILVTGGAGFIGGSFIRKTLSSIPGIAVVNVDALTYASNLEGLKEFEGNPRYAFCKVDIDDGAAIRNILLTYAPNYIIHFAAHTHVDRSIDSPWPFINTNIVGTLSLLEEIRRWEKPSNFKFIHVSTDEVYGSTTRGKPFTEETRYDPSSPYSASKAASDHLVRTYHRTYGMPAVVTNCCNNYGPYQFPEKLMPLMILNGMEGKELPVYGTGQNVRDWIHVDDHVQALWYVITGGVPGETYNIGANCELTNLEVVHKICDSLDKLAAVNAIPSRNYRDLIKFVRDRPGHDVAYSICSRKIRSLGWSPTVEFEDGLNRTVRWYFDNRDWAAQIHDRRRLGDAQGNFDGGRRGNTVAPSHEDGQ